MISRHSYIYIYIYTYIQLYIWVLARASGRFFRSRPTLPHFFSRFRHVQTTLRDRTAENVHVRTTFHDLTSLWSKWWPKFWQNGDQTCWPDLLCSPDSLLQVALALCLYMHRSTLVYIYIYVYVFFFWLMYIHIQISRYIQFLLHIWLFPNWFGKHSFIEWDGQDLSGPRSLIFFAKLFSNYRFYLFSTEN